ncbi:hypothetical protein [Parachryseolinea silvisoli]|nr:hypothetical protein [Parachryseolinea silvisoli]
MEAKASKSKYFTSLDYYSKREAKVNLCEALRAAGWKIYGYHEN